MADKFSTFPDETVRITLSQEDIARAVEFWLNEKILKNPATVVAMSQTSINSHSTFDVQLLQGKIERT